MKKLIVILIVFMMLISILGCSGMQSKPSEDLIEINLQDQLDEYCTQNESFSLDIIDFEIIKSLTENKSYNAQINVTAQSKYANFYYTADVAYTKYDQGWAIDFCNWDMKSYEVITYPTMDEVNHLEISYTVDDEVYTDPADIYMNGLTDIKLDGNGNVFCVSGKYICDWHSYVTAEQSVSYYWNYDAFNDNWIHEDTVNNKLLFTLTPAFDNGWTKLHDYCTIKFTNITESGFDLEYDSSEFRIDSCHVEITAGHIFYLDPDRHFMNLYGESINVTYYDKIKASECCDDLSIYLDINEESEVEQGLTFDAFCYLDIANHSDTLYRQIDSP